MSKIKFEAVVRDRGSLLKIGSINSANLVPLIGQKVKVSVTPLLDDSDRPCPKCKGPYLLSSGFCLECAEKVL